MFILADWIIERPGFIGGRPMLYNYFSQYNKDPSPAPPGEFNQSWATDTSGGTSLDTNGERSPGMVLLGSLSTCSIIHVVSISAFLYVLNVRLTCGTLI
jgi:hypothetical protein